MQRVGGSTRPEWRTTLALAGPVVVAELGWMAMGVVDTIIVGRLGAEAIGAVGVGSILFVAVAMFGMGLLFGLDTLVAQAFGAGEIGECHRSLVQAIYCCLVVAPITMGVLWWGTSRLATLGLDPAVSSLVVPYLRAIAWGTLPLLVFTALRRYSQAMGVVGPVVFALVSANAVNALANWVLVFGLLGFPALGVEGSGWATTLSRVYMALVMAGAVFLHDRRHETGLWRTSPRPDPARLRRLIGLGTPAALQLTLEIGVFAVATALAGRLSPDSLAAHQIVLSVASLTFMVPLGVATAAAVEVGQALGRRDRAASARAGWSSIRLGAAFMACSGLAFWAFPGAIVSAFTTDPAVIATGASLLRVAACFQLFDGLQVVTTGALRGTGDTRSPMVVTLLAHWLLGLPVGYALAFPAGLGVLGLWVGLSLGLIAAGLVLLGLWSSKARSLLRGDSPDPTPETVPAPPKYTPPAAPEVRASRPLGGDGG